MVVIDPEDELFRRLHHDAVEGELVKRTAFMTDGQYDREISMHLAKLLKSPQDCLRTRPDFGLGVLTVAQVRELGFVVQYDPQPGDDAHVLVIGENNKQIARSLAAKMVVRIPPRTVVRS